MALKDVIFYPIMGFNKPADPITKISIIGAGGIGMTAAYTIVLKGVCDELAIVDVNEDRIEGELLDLNLGHDFLSHTKVIGSTDYSISKKSNIVIICAGVRQKENETRSNFVQRNVNIYKVIIPQIVKHSPDCIILITTPPVDIFSYVTWKLSGFPRSRVFGTGTMLDSSRFKGLLGEKLGIDSSNIQAFIVGEQGEHSVPIWSSVSVSGNQLKSLMPKIGAPDDPDNFMAVFKDVILSSYKIMKDKGTICWANGSTIAALCTALLCGKKEIFPVSILVKHDGLLANMNVIDKEIFLSLPCVISSSGITHIVPITMTEQECLELSKCAKNLEDIIRDIHW